MAAAKTDIIRAICNKGGMILYDNLQDMGLSPPEELKRIISQNSDTLSEVYIAGQRFVTAKSRISLCKVPGCLECDCLHICEDYMMGHCNDIKCASSHDLHTPHNFWILKQHGLQGLKEHEISVLLFQDEAPCPKQFQLPTEPPSGLPAIFPPQGPPCERPRLLEDHNISFPWNQGSDDICQMNLIHRCSAGGQCNKLHSNTPYLWQRRRRNQWWSFPNNEEIERDYCDPRTTKHDGSPPVDFDLMQSGLDKVRRLSVTSADFYTASLLSTKWVWYWELSEHCWKEYAAPGDIYFEQKGKENDSAITSEKLEQKYQEGDTSFQFAHGGGCYILSFVDMIQTNLITDMKRLVRRRPVMISSVEVQKICEKYEKIIQPNFLSSVPQHWNHSLLPSTGYERVRMESSSQDYRSILSQFNKTMSGASILGIERIQNLKLWRSFILQRNQMKNDSSKDVTMQRLFYGSKSDYVDAVCHNNIDWSFSAVKETRFGKGCYFAKDASCANKHTDKQAVRFMFLCQVVVGDYALGKPDHLRPPFKDDNKTVSFDSCVDDLAQPRLYVVFEKHQIYPDFLIKYQVEDGEMEMVSSLKPPSSPKPTAPTPTAHPQPVYEDVKPPQIWPILPPPPVKKRCDCDSDCCDCCDCCYSSCCLL